MMATEDDSDLAPLAPGTRLHAFVLQKPIGRGGSGIVYAADHEILRETFAIKEFLPNQLAHRIDDQQVAAYPGKTDIFDKLRRKFLEEGQTLIQLARPYPHPNLVQVTDAFRANETVYLCMRFEYGKPLETLLREEGPIGEEQLREWLLALMDGLEHAHERLVWHRDLKPSNILVRNDSTPVIIDFGAAHQERPDSAVSQVALYTPGFAAPEQMFQGPQGPWTDIYALAATFHFAITGHSPPTHFEPDWHGQGGRYSRELLAALRIALSFDPARRPQSIAAWRALLLEPSPEHRTADSSLKPDIGEDETIASELSFLPNDAVTEVMGATSPAEEVRPAIERETLSSDPSDAAPADTMNTPASIPAEGSGSKARRTFILVGALILMMSSAALVYFVSNWQQPAAEMDTRDTQEAQLETELETELETGQEQPPAPLAQPIENLASAIRSRLSGLECSHLAFSSDEEQIRLSGYVRDPKQLDELMKDLSEVAPDATILDTDMAFAAPFCDVLALLDQASPEASAYPDRPQILFSQPNRVYHENQYLVLTAANRSDLGGYLYLDFVDSDGSIVHIFPTKAREDNYLRPGSQVVIGAQDDRECKRQPDDCYVVSRPHGNNLIIAAWSESPMFQDVRTPQSESEQDYLPFLAEALEQRTGAQERQTLGYYFFTTRP